ncbi:hypothetical protein [Streptomyces scabiei]|uniref:hypothetical protein n=1 Tax=Streptomyces scabiei TaxID=1930 RepID=UPI0029A844FF|nr:hypothetical protein [Streptomyces scabiei]MDX2800122.1 hypothetical protein [Streptomyces scabiei]MDX3125375.1 hypothetical protein [Streptomyces scabiei]MDX3280142.1 hypothetical protein [Streptomyces scabiei]MDX3280166.1 hypothetical protein [Streptomyces scabiei]
MTESTTPLTEQQLDDYAVLAITADHDGTKVDPTVVTVLVDHVRRLQHQRRFLLASMARKDARTGDGNRALANFLGTEPTEPSRHLEDGSTHTVQALTEAGESCVQQQCTAAREEKRLRQEQYALRTEVEGVLDEVGHMAADERLTADVASELRRLLRSALGLDRQIT